MENFKISQELQKKSDDFFENFRLQMMKDFGHIYKDLEFATFFEGVVRIIVFEAFDLRFGHKKTMDNLQSRTLKIFGGVIESELIPFFEQLNTFGLENGVSPEIMVDYIYSYCIRSLSNVLPQEVMKTLNLEFKKDTGELQESEAEKRLLNKWHIINLIKLAKADGIFDEDEKAFLRKKAQKLNLNISEIEVEFDKDNDQDQQLPAQAFRKIEYFVDLVLMMVADSDIHQHEIDFCILMGKKYEFPKELVIESIDIFKKALKKGRQPITAVPDVIRLLKECNKLK